MGLEGGFYLKQAMRAVKQRLLSDASEAKKIDTQGFKGSRSQPKSWKNMVLVRKGLNNSTP